VNSRARYFLLAGVAGLLAFASPAAAHDGDDTGQVVVRTERIGGGERTLVTAHTDAIRAEPVMRRSSAGRVAGGIAGLPATWCGTETASDDRTRALSDLPQVKVVYAHAPDRPNHFAAFAAHAQTDVESARSTVSFAAAGRKTIRFDLGTRCGTRYVDVQSVTLPHPLAYYSNDAMYAADRLEADLKAAVLPSAKGVRNFIVYADGVQPSYGVTGIAELVSDDRHGAANYANLGGLWGFVFGDGNGSWRTATFLHETTHLLGGVQGSAPHATPAGHCYDEDDVMCYDDGSLAPWPGLTVCSGAARFDCDADDYFNPSPAAGSYLAGHWNMYDSSFMCSASACGGSEPRTPPHAAFSITSGGRRVASVRVGKSVTFDGRASTSAAGPPRFAWDLDGDGATDANESVLARRYAKPGRRTVRLRVADADGVISTATRTLTVVPVARTASVSTSSRLRSALRATIVALRRGRLSGLARGKRVRLAFRAPGRGRLSLRVSAGRRHVASGTRTFRGARRGTLAVRVSRAARPLLRRRAMRLTLRVSFHDGRGRTSTRSAAVVLRR
jgi:hypothetical protein